MASQPPFSEAALRVYLRNLKTADGMCSLAASPPEFHVQPSQPRLFQVDDWPLQHLLPGSVFFTAAGEVRYVPHEDAIRESRRGG